jgi:hypothetical protein
VHDLMSDARSSTGARSSVATHVAETDLIAVCEHVSSRLPPFGEGDEGDLLRDTAAGIRARLAAVNDRALAAKTVESNARLWQSYRHLAQTITQHAQTPAASSPAQALMELDLDVALLECWTRLAKFDRALADQA